VLAGRRLGHPEHPRVVPANRPGKKRPSQERPATAAGS
jgi:hypothetical protein